MDTLIAVIKRSLRQIIPVQTLNTLRIKKKLEARLARNEACLRSLASNYLLNTYPKVAKSNSSRNRFRGREAKVFSEHGEDGILLYIFSTIGVTNRRFVEFGFGDGVECNTANLSINFGWHGLLMDRSVRACESAKDFYSKSLTKATSAVLIRKQFITRHNINGLLERYSFKGEIDLLSIDIDGNDYWVWKEIEVISPRLVVIEYNASFGPEFSVTIPYEAKFDRHSKHYSGWYHGASLKALQKLGQEKGYRLIGCESAGVNAFLVREDLATRQFPPLSAGEAYFPHLLRSEKCSSQQQYERIRHLELINV